jgi:hypothetical protein
MNQTLYLSTFHWSKPRTPDRDSFPGSQNCKVSLVTRISYLGEGGWHKEGVGDIKETIVSPGVRGA